MSRPLDVAVVVGSLRAASFNRRIAKQIMALAPDSLSMEIVEIGDLPLYSEDLDASPPQAWTAFRERIRRADGVLFATPEYNRSIPAPLKNAIDVGSRPYGQSAWSGAPCGVVSASVGAIGGFGANHHLRQSLVFLDMPALQQPEIYIGHVQKLVDDAGNLTDDRTRQLLSKFAEKLAAWITQHPRARG